MITVSNMSAALILMIAVLAGGTQAGYEYPKPAIPFELPTNNAAEVPLSKSRESVVSYSVPFEDFHYLKHHKVEYQNSPYNDPHTGSSLAPNTNKIHSANEGTSDLKNIVQPAVTGFGNSNAEASGRASITNQHVSGKDNSAAAKYIVSPPEVSFVNNDVVSSEYIPYPIVSTGDDVTLVQNIIQQTQNEFIQPEILQSTVEPLVTKHIYFHVPPPDIEEALASRFQEPPKKIFKIILIKAPSQESVNAAQLQQAVSSQIAPIEHKTLIYVLVKKQEPVQILQRKPSPSEHEVLFVKYKEKQISAPLSAASNLLQENSVLNAVPNLQPGLANGQL